MLTIPASPATLLMIRFQGLWHAMMEDEPHIGLIDTHTERDSGTDHLHFPSLPHFLMFLTRRLRKSSMVRRSAKSSRETTTVIAFYL